MAATEVANMLLNAGAMIAAENIPYKEVDSTGDQYQCGLDDREDPDSAYYRSMKPRTHRTPLLSGTTRSKLHAKMERIG